MTLGWLVLSEPLTGRMLLSGAIVLASVLPATGAHIHRGGVSDAGPVKVALNNPTEVGTSGVGLASGCEEVKTKLLRRIRANPQRFYVNVHTAKNKGGTLKLANVTKRINDLLVVLMVTQDKSWMLYYAAMATGGSVAGCYVTEGYIRRGTKVRLLRDNVVVFDGALKTLKGLKGPQLLHVITTKGKGYELAEGDQIGYHAVSPFDPTQGLVSKPGAKKPTYQKKSASKKAPAKRSAATKKSAATASKRSRSQRATRSRSAMPTSCRLSR